MNSQLSSAGQRSIGLVGATGIGVGAMVGGGVFALAGVAFAASGPSAILAFVFNGLIALITALSFAEMATGNPRNGGTYTYAKRALTVQIAFGVGWVVWFASLVAAVLYALGFGAFLAFALQHLPLGDSMGALVHHAAAPVAMALLSVAYYAIRIYRGSGGGGALANVVKLAVFGLLIAGGLAVMVRTPFSHITESVTPFFTGGIRGLLAAMGYTFIALQGFDLIASAAGEIKEPEKTIPRAMVYTLAVGLAIYVPLLFVVMTVGMQPGEGIAEVSAANPETVVAIAAQNYLGAFGFWFVLVAAIASMLSALQANLFAASRIAMSMANDRTLSHHLAYIHPRHNTPSHAVLTTAAIVTLLILVLPDVAAAGAASSLIFLITFALAHLVMMLMRKRRFAKAETFNVPWYPVLPILGMVACLGLALFQAVAVPAAGIISLLWLLAGLALFVSFFIQRARAVDASEEALDPDLVRLRGLSPLVLLPISNPANAESMVFVANALAPPVVGRVLLLSIVKPSEDTEALKRRLMENREAIFQALSASFVSGLRPDALTTIADEPWEEIDRVIRVHRCRSILLGLSSFSDLRSSENLEKLVKRAPCDVVVMRSPYSGWKISDARTVLIPVAGLSAHDTLRARVAAILWRTSHPSITFLQILPSSTPEGVVRKNQHHLARFAGRIIPGKTQAVVSRSDDVKSELIRQTALHDLVIMGLGKPGPTGRAFGQIPLSMAEETKTALIFISHK